MKKKTDSLLFKFAVIFGAFMILTLTLSGVATYYAQMKTYKEQCLDNTRKIGDYLESLIQETGDEFIEYQNYYMKHYSEIDIPYDFTEYQTALKECRFMFSRLGECDAPKISGLKFSGLSDEMKKKIFIYLHEYWILVFENARKTFNLPYTYYLVPKEDEFKMVYMIDGERSHRGPDGQKSDTGEYLYLGDEYYDDYESYKIQWDSWFTGEKQNDFQVWNNDWGHTYAYYTPLIIKGKKLGLIGTEVNVADVNGVILKNTIVQTGTIALVLFGCIVLVLLIINKVYISKIVRLEADLREYASEKNPEIVEKIEGYLKGRDEISSLSWQFVSLIREIENYIKNLMTTSIQLVESQKQVNKMSVLANKDPLTGIRNKNAYDNELRRLEWQISGGDGEFGIVMIDLNFLKNINDSFGHDRGNISIKKLCQIICQVFEHSPVFRIGGDEFVVLLERYDYKNVESLVAEFNREIEHISKDESLEPWERVSAALGYALYDKKIDKSVHNVFRRADKAMYTRKKEMKAVRLD